MGKIRNLRDFLFILVVSMHSSYLIKNNTLHLQMKKRYITRNILIVLSVLISAITMLKYYFLHLMKRLYYTMLTVNPERIYSLFLLTFHSRLKNDSRNKPDDIFVK